jgi:CheY-like chemotaxis protein
VIGVLLAEDQAMVRGALASLLGLEDDLEVVAQVGRGDEVLEAARRARPDVALLDIGMPKVNGYEVCRRIRAQPWGKEMLLVALTGWGQDDDRRRTEYAGFDHHLVKPVERSELLERVLRAGRSATGG